MFMGDFFQIYAKTEWKLDTKAFSNFIAIIGILGFTANSLSSIFVRRLGIRRFTAITTLSSILPNLGAATFGYSGILAGNLVGFMGVAQGLGVMSAIVSEGTKQGVPMGVLAGERASLMALVKVIGPIWYSTLYVQGQRLWNMKTLPFWFNACLGFAVFTMSQVYL